jgi:hypothetical protein
MLMTFKTSAVSRDGNLTRHYGSFFYLPTDMVTSDDLGSQPVYRYASDWRAIFRVCIK